MNILQRIKNWAKRIKRDSITLWFACKNSKTPFIAKALGLLVVAYALSPIDLIPDFIPIFGYLDDAILLPILILLTIKLLPDDVLKESREQAEHWINNDNKKPTSKLGLILIIAIWMIVAFALYFWFYEKLY